MADPTFDPSYGVDPYGMNAIPPDESDPAVSSNVGGATFIPYDGSGGAAASSQGGGATFTPYDTQPAQQTQGGAVFTPYDQQPQVASTKPDKSSISTGNVAGIPRPTPAAEKLIRKYDTDPQRAALQRLIVGLESGGGHPEEPNSATAYGPYQITRGTAHDYGLDYSRLNELDYATSAANLILTKLMMKAKGNRVQAAIGYNAGPGWLGEPFNTLPSDTQVYAQRVVKGLAELNTQHPGGPTPEQKVQTLKKTSPKPSPGTPGVVVPPGTKVSQAGFGGNPMGIYHAIATPFEYIGQGIDFAHRHPGEAIEAVEGFLERPVLKTFESIANFSDGRWKDPGKVLRDIGISVVRPQDHDRIITAIETGIFHDMGFKNVHPDQMHNLGMGVVNFMIDIGLDPFSYIGVGEFMKLSALVAKTSAKTVYMAPVINDMLKAAGHTKQGQWLIDKTTGFADKIGYLVTEAKGAAYKLVGIRQDLDTWERGAKFPSPLNDKAGKPIPHTGPKIAGTQVPLFTTHGKLARLGVEHGPSEEIGRTGNRIEHELFSNQKITDPMDATTVLAMRDGIKKGQSYWEQLPHDVAVHALTYFSRHGDVATQKWSREMLDKIGHTIPPKDLTKYKGGYVTVPETGTKSLQGLENTFRLTAEQEARAGTHLPEDVRDANNFFKRETPEAKAELGAESMTNYTKNMLILMRYKIRRQLIARESARLSLEEEGKLGKVLHSMPKGQKTEDQMTQWFLNNVQDHADPIHIFEHVFGKGKIGGETADKLMARISQTWKASILGNPIPHGIINLGMTVLAHSNPYVAGRGIYYLFRGVPQHLIDHLEVGASSSYWRKAVPTLSTLLPGSKKLLAKSTAILDRMENAHRASYYEYLSKKWGTLAPGDPGYLMHEMAKLQTVNEHLGDYSNPSKLAAILRALGGLYTVFRFDVVPRAAWAAATGKVGQNLGAALKFGHDVGQSVGPGQVHINIADDMAKILVAAPTLLNPTQPGIGGTGVDYVTSIASLGPIFGSAALGLTHRMSNVPPQTPLQAVEGFLAYTVIGGASFQQIVDPSTVEQKIPIWFRLVMHAFGGWYGRINPKTESQRQKQYRKAAKKIVPLEKWITELSHH